MTRRGTASLILGGGLAALLPLVAGCTFTVELEEHGTRIDVADYESVKVGDHGLSEVLATLGPPDSLGYGVHDEILEYYYVRTWKTKLRFDAIFASFPGLSQIRQAIGVFRGVFQFAAVDDSVPAELTNPERLEDRDPLGDIITSVSKRGVGRMMGGFTRQEVLDLDNERRRQTVLRVVIDRKTDVVREKSFNDPSRDESLLQTAILQQ